MTSAKGFIIVSQFKFDKTTKPRYVNFNNISDIGEINGENYICFAGNSDNYLKVKETPEEVFNLIIANQQYHTTF